MSLSLFSAIGAALLGKQPQERVVPEGSEQGAAPDPAPQAEGRPDLPPGQVVETTYAAPIKNVLSQNAGRDCFQSVWAMSGGTAKAKFREKCRAKGANRCAPPLAHRGPNIIPLFKTAEGDSRKFQVENGKLVEDRESAMKALAYLRDSLKCGMPVWLAVSYLHQKKHQFDGATDHHVLVWLWREKADGTIILEASDPATKKEDMKKIEFVVDKDLRIVKQPDPKGKWISPNNPRPYLGTYVVVMPITKLACQEPEPAAPLVVQNDDQ